MGSIKRGAVVATIMSEPNGAGETNAQPGRKPRVVDGEILDVFRGGEAPVFTTAGVAEELPLTRRSVYNRLVDLEQRGVVESMIVGQTNARVWWLPAEAWERVAGGDRE